ncbi:hypothetical protein AB1L30_22795 [Bremerella sp. JC817]|uniref:hypothetical protein n=1 Tax=Bremerella sp. JC817 TaxID=3231756 RepID=UPI00345915B8
MDMVAVSCQNCGAPLDVPAELKHVTCGHCGTALVVRHSGSVLFTETVRQLEKHAQTMQVEIRQLQIQQEIERLDREWVDIEDHHRLPSKYGHGDVPTLELAILIWICGGGFTIACAIFFQAPLWLMATGVAAAAGLVIKLLADSYQRDRKDYLAKRDRLVEESEALLTRYQRK